MSKNFAIVIDKCQANNYLSSKLVNTNVIALTPDAYYFLKNKKIKNLTNPFLILKNYDYTKIVVSNKILSNKIKVLFKSNVDFSSVQKENFKNYLLLINSTLNYIWLSLPNHSYFFVFNNNQITKLSKVNAHSFILKYIKSQKIGIFKNEIPNNVYKFYYLKKILNNIIFYILRKKKIIFFSEKNKNFTKIAKLIYSNNNSTISISFSRKYSNSLLSLFFYIFNFLNFFFMFEKFFFIFSPHLKKKSMNSYLIQKNILKLKIPIISNNLEILNSFFLNIFAYLKALDEFLNHNKLLKKSRLLIADYLTWNDNSVLGNFFKKNYKEVILASHGITPYSKELYSRLELNNLCNGLITSPFATTILAQSPTAYRLAVTKNFYKSEIIKSHPISYNGLRKSFTNSNKIKIQTILYANTYKVFASRPWIYETSFEYLENLRKLCDAIKNLKNTQLLIKIRLNDELSIQTIKEYIVPNDKIIFFTEGNIDEFCQKADLLITGFSTVIDEFMYLNKPVVIFGDKRKYQPYKLNNKIDEVINKNILKPIYYLDNKNLTFNLKTILNLVRKKKINENKNKNFLWKKDEALFFKKFIKMINKKINDKKN